MSFTKKDIEHLQARGKIRGYVITPMKRKGNVPVARKPSPQKEWLELNLQWWCNENAVELQGEFQFAGDRKWRFDWAIRALKIGIEYEGIYSAKSRHTTRSGFTGDIEKYNRAQMEEWTVLRYTAKDYKNVLRDQDKILLTTPNLG